VLGLLAVILLLTGTIIGLIYWIQPVRDPHYLPLWVDQYRDARIPFNPWAEADRKAMLAMGWPEKSAFGRQEHELLKSELASLENRSDRPVVVYLCAQAICDDRGEVFVLPGDAALDRADRWLPLRDVLGYMQKCRAAHKLLILDIGRPFVVPELGLLQNNAVEKSHDLLEQAVEEDSKLFILTACAPGQTSLPLEAEGRTVFGYYLEQGLSGQADGYNARHKRDSRVSVEELAAFVVARVDRWARLNRQARQTPRLLLGSAKDFVLLTARGAPPEPDEETSTQPSYPPQFQDGWKLLDGWRGDTVGRAPAAQYRLLESALLHAERQWHGGAAQAEIDKELRKHVDEFTRQREEAIAARATTEPRSLAEEVVRGRKPPDLEKDGALTKLRALADLAAKPVVKKPADKDAAKPAPDKDADKIAAERDAFLETYKGKPFDLAWTVFEAACREPQPRPEQLQFWDSLIVRAWEPLPAANRPRYGETKALHELALWSVQVNEAWPPAAVHLVLQVVREAAQTAAADPAFLPWVTELAKAAAKSRDEGQRLLADWDPRSVGAITKHFEDALRGYTRVNQALRALEQAQRQLEEALARLPGLAVYVEQEPAALERWRARVLDARKLRSLLQGPPARDATMLTNMLSEMESLTASLREELNRLGQPSDPGRWKKMTAPQGQPTPAAWTEVDAVLTGPAGTAAQRHEWSDIRRQMAVALHQDTRGRDQAEDAAHQPTPPPSDFDSARASRLGREKDVIRARVAIALLQLEGRADVKELEEALGRVEKEPQNAKAWSDLSQRYRSLARSPAK
jgi:hypothetical protein